MTDLRMRQIETVRPTIKATRQKSIKVSLVFRLGPEPRQAFASCSKERPTLSTARNILNPAGKELFSALSCQAMPWLIAVRTSSLSIASLACSTIP
jgi:hypothetical protein